MFRQLVVYFCLATASIVLTEAVACPENCYCSIHWLWSRNVFVVTRYYRNMSSIPDLTQLSNVSLPIYLKFSYSNLTRVTKADFPPNLGINFLSLGGNRRLVVEEDALSNMRNSLIYLDLESIRLYFNSTLTFLRGLTKLETLILSFNNKHEYKTVAPDVTVSLFGGLGLVSLKKLKMYSCGMKTMAGRVFNDVETIEEIDLDANGFSSIPDAITGLRNLKNLDLSHSYFEFIRSRTFTQNKKLTTLTIMYSKVKSIDATAFEGLENSLDKLDLGRSVLTEFPTVPLKRLAALKVLKLDKNRIRSIASGSLSGSYCLKRLSLSGMNLSFSEDMFEGQENCIQDLELRGVSLSNIPRKSFLTLNKLQNLFLEDNFISELKPHSLSGIKASLFVLTRNPLTRIDNDAFAGTTRPLYLAIDFTAINNLKFVLSYPKGTFASLDVNGLPISCDCTTARVVKLMEKGTLSGNCDNMETGASIGLQTDTVYQYMSQRCPGVLTASGSVPMDTYNLTILYTLLFVCWISVLYL